jgi:hypothetical protein
MQIVVTSQSALIKDYTSGLVDCCFVYIKMWLVWLFVFSSWKVQVCLSVVHCGNIVFLTARYFLCGRVYYSIPIITTVFMETLIFSCKFENIFSHCFFFLYDWNPDWIHTVISDNSCPLYHHFCCQVSACTFRTVLQQDLLALHMTFYH